MADLTLLDPGRVLHGLDQHPELSRAAHVDPNTLLRIVRAFPTAAVAASKYDDQVRNAVIAAELGMSVRTVQRARWLLRHLVEVEPACTRGDPS